MIGKLPASDDGVLVSQVLQGRTEALEDLYRRLFGPLVRYCRRISTEDPEDLAQEAWTRALANLASFDVSRPLWPWLKTIAAHLATDTARKRGRELVVDVEEMDAAASPSQTSAVEDRWMLTAAIARLTPGQRAALGLRYIEDWDNARAAEYLGLNQAAFRRLLFRARQRLRAECLRLSQGAGGLIALCLDHLRRITKDASLRLRRMGTRAGHHQGLAGEAMYQLVAGAVSLSLLGGAPHALSMPASEPPDRPPTVAAPDPGQARSGGDSRVSDRAAPHPVQDPPSEEGTPGGKKTDQAVRDIGRWVTDPEEGAQQPEDSRILSIHPSPRFEDDGVAFAVGASSCEEITCSSLLFETADGGSTWTRLPSRGLVAESLMLPPAFGGGDDRIFAMGREGLQVSEDRGHTFARPSPAMGPHLAGPAAMSPAFSSGDPAILIGTSIAARYRDGEAAPEPLPNPTSSSPIEPGYSPAYEDDGIVILGGTRFDESSGTRVATLDRCIHEKCTQVTIHSQSSVPKPRFSPGFGEDGQLYAFTYRGLFSSSDWGEHFEQVSIPSSEEFLFDVRPLDAGTLVASTLPGHSGQAGVYLSTDGGRSWEPFDDPLLSQGALSIAVTGDRIFAVLATKGIACSADRGAIWATRC